MLMLKCLNLREVSTVMVFQTWEFEAIDQAEAQEEGTFLELEPMNEMRVSPHAKLTSLQKVEDEGTVCWYCMVSTTTLMVGMVYNQSHLNSEDIGE